jgi:hypothetical protein
MSIFFVRWKAACFSREITGEVIEAGYYRFSDGNGSPKRSHLMIKCIPDVSSFVKASIVVCFQEIQDMRPSLRGNQAALAMHQAHQI